MIKHNGRITLDRIDVSEFPCDMDTRALRAIDRACDRFLASRGLPNLDFRAQLKAHWKGQKARRSNAAHELWPESRKD